MRKPLIQFLMAVFLSGFSVSILSHDTTHIHPLITAKIAELIQDLDTVKAYSEIYEPSPNPDPDIPPEVSQLLYWGTDFDPVGMSDAQAQGQLSEYLVDDQIDRYLNGLLSLYSPKGNNVINGVVYEDVPAITKVRHHFYQAIRGDGLTVSIFNTIGDSSAIRAMGFYNQSIEKMGYYSQASKEEAFFLFGQALHHVEDMTSPAHVHNDAHLDILPLERDDYEGWWLPQQKVNEADLVSYLGTATSVQPVTNPWVNIWGIKNTDNSLVQQTWTKTTFNATLTYTFSVFNEVGNSYEYFSPPNTNEILPQGEMAQMFPCPLPLGDKAPHCLHWSEDAPDAPAHWVINGVGDFQHQVDTGTGDAWWPIELETDVYAYGKEPSQFGASKAYYIEQLASNNSTSNPNGNVLIPAALRSPLSDAVNWQRNMVTNNTKPVVQQYAEELLTPAVTYGAGFTQNWYDIANTPPYLVGFQALQAPKNGAVENLVYAASWGNIEAGDSVVEARKLKLVTESVAHIHGSKNLTLQLSFNEPIKQITQIIIGTVNVTSSMSALADSGTDDKVWTVVIPVVNIASLNGKAQVTIKAQDKNRHFDGFGFSEGTELDATPETPARRNVTFANDTRESGNPEFRYPWYQQGGLDETPEDIAYSYDFDNGDQNHWLVFDTGNPTATITINTVLPPPPTLP